MVLSIKAWASFYVLQLTHGDLSPARYTVDLGQDPAHRWDHVAAAQKEVVVHAVQSIFSNPRIKPVIPLARLIVGNALEAQRLLPGTLLVEAKGIARETGLEVQDLVLVGVFYDLFAAAKSPLAFAACMGVVAQSTSGEITHGRNLDYDFAADLAKITLVIDFARNRTTVFTAVTFGPNPTFNTAVKWGGFSVTQNERDRGNVLTNLWDIVLLGRPALFGRIRKAMETVPTFEEAVLFFSEVKLSAAAYFILGGTKPGEGAVVTRDRDAVVDVWRLNPVAGLWYVLETNYDRTAEVPTGDDRRHPLERALDATGPQHINADSIWRVLSLKSVNVSAGERSPLNNATIYSTVMQASNPATFRTLVRTPSVARLSEGSWQTPVLV
mmetsp:Transcript_41040/g.114058  ORF Transcript_41040/g.114058 Transcript_41040/m.114058 type:complete len:383 (-) Transcript_41040:207-1355(-)